MENLLTTYCNRHDGLIVSEGTLRDSDLLYRFANTLLDFSDTRRNHDMAKEAFDILEEFGDFGYGDSCDEMTKDVRERVTYLIFEELYSALCRIAPKGFYFGSSDGDSACIGYFLDTEEDY